MSRFLLSSPSKTSKTSYNATGDGPVSSRPKTVTLTAEVGRSGRDPLIFLFFIHFSPSGEVSAPTHDATMMVSQPTLHDHGIRRRDIFKNIKHLRCSLSYLSAPDSSNPSRTALTLTNNATTANQLTPQGHRRRISTICDVVCSSPTLRPFQPINVSLNADG